MEQNSEASPGRRHYAYFGLLRSLRQVKNALHEIRGVKHEIEIRYSRLQRDEQRIQEVLGRPVEDLDVLVIGPGPQLPEARYFSVRNRVTGIDLDVIPLGMDIPAYLRMLRRNGLGRLAKTLGRKILLYDHVFQRGWKHALGVRKLTKIRLLIGDICAGPPEKNAFDLVTSWSTFQHIPDPERALQSIVDSLRPGGVFYFGLHLWTSNSGHHDMRAFSGGHDELPSWAHLRSSTSASIKPSAWINRWRLPQWRELAESLTPGYVEYRETYGSENRFATLTEKELAELSEYTEDELVTVDIFYAWKKPMG